MALSPGGARLSVDTDAATGGITVMHVRGELDISSAPILRAHLEPLRKQADLRALVMDIAEVSFCDSTGLSELIAAFNHCRTRGAGFALAGARGIMQRLLTITGLRSHLTIFPDVTTAIHEMTKDSLPLDP
ncbi:STAS domain-containing protein [Planomonospora sp. ID67723]|uniref:STAS domain-containing protein n=1 Tax=Planomonospora sp. ID67723 TaxID=2738134 RepID=UPI0018C3F7CE|nr:STAS domain-containing protein [Planomonospora sp. ID67723]MBG0828244.1 STAS domain-containing protein [Planomonospora sp. ID67723]